MSTASKKHSISLWLTSEALRRLDARTEAAAAAAGVPVQRGTLAAALLHGALGLRPDGSEHPAQAAALASEDPASKGSEEAATVLGGFATLARVKGTERRGIVAGYVRELCERCGLSQAGAVALLKERETKRRLRLSLSDF